MGKIKYRIKQIGNVYYPQVKRGLFSRWKNLRVPHINSWNCARGRALVTCFNFYCSSLSEANDLIKKYIECLKNSGIYKGHSYFYVLNTCSYRLAHYYVILPKIPNDCTDWQQVIYAEELNEIKRYIDSIEEKKRISKIRKIYSYVED